MASTRVRLELTAASQQSVALVHQSRMASTVHPSAHRKAGSLPQQRDQCMAERSRSEANMRSKGQSLAVMGTAGRKAAVIQPAVVTL